jgi:hypothetical protein
MYRRALTPLLRDALGDTPVVFLHGARQTGKTTLVRALVDEEPARSYLTLDDRRLLAAATDDPEGFVDGLDGPVVIDEVQRAPDLFRTLKVAVDRDRRPGRFLLTGSAHLLVLPQLAESLVGRMEVLTLWPLAQSEIEGTERRLVDTLFGDAPLPAGEIGESRRELMERIVRGGYPEAVQRATGDRRRAWFEAYVTTLLQRDVRELSNIDGLVALPDLLRLLAARATTLLNAAELSRTSRIPATTLKRYLGLLEGTFLIQRLPAWSANLSKRLVRSPKIAFLDTGLLCHLQGLDAGGLADDPLRFGPAFESFVVQELQKHLTWSRTRPRLYHYRSHGGQEIDVVLEDAAGRVVGVEVKSRSNVTGRDFRALRELAELLGDRFRRGVVFYTGDTAVPFGERLHALPASWLWHPGS